MEFDDRHAHKRTRRTNIIKELVCTKLSALVSGANGNLASVMRGSSKREGMEAVTLANNVVSSNQLVLATISLGNLAL
jgi:hypothetical protein